MVIGIDTSNYTTSAAVLQDGKILHAKKMLSVKAGERGLRQSDAVFQHTVNLPEVLSRLTTENIRAVGVSTKPRGAEDSYMPCFLVGKTVAGALAKGAGVPLYTTSHQVNHILAALYGAGQLSLIHERFLAFHLSGGTTEALLVTPDKDEVLRVERVAQSTDLKAGQAIDRAGVMLGLDFPCGKALDALSRQSEKSYRYRPSMQGADCSLSGVENKAKAMFERGEAKEDIARFVLTCVSAAVAAMLEQLMAAYGTMPVVFSGGVASNTMLREVINSRCTAYFAPAEFSLDNAAGCAVYAYIKEEKI